MITPKRKRRRLKVYCWPEVLCDYTCGMIVAVAYSVEEARELIRTESRNSGYVMEQVATTPEILGVSPKAYIAYGGS